MRIATCFLAALTALFSLTAAAQESGTQPAAPQPGAATQTPTPAYSQEQLDTLVAPIALYPDEMLAQVLTAATYPLEVVQADRWLASNKTLQGDALAQALEQQPWAPSVKSLVNFPDVLDMMDQNLSWTQQLGDAFLAQEEDVMAAVQRLRSKAQSSGSLETTEQQTVVTEPGTDVIVIQPADPEVVYVPTYNPTVVYGTWPYPTQPYYYHPPGYAAAPGVAFASGVALGAAWGYAWNDVDWDGGDIDVDVDKNVKYNSNINRSEYARRYEQGGGRWQHDASHRKGVPYRDQSTAARYNRSAATPGAASRQAYRGRSPATTYPSRGAAPRAGAAGAAGAARTPSTAARQRAAQAPQARPTGTYDRGSAFSGINSGSQARNYSSRGSASRSSMSRSGGGRSGGSRGGGGRGGGGRGGGGRR